MYVKRILLNLESSFLLQVYVKYLQLCTGIEVS
jgi:hypothetical protein